MLLLMAGGEFSSASSKQLEVQQLGLIRDTATSICNTVKDASGKSTNSQVQGEIKGELSGLFSRLATAGLSGTGSIIDETLDGLTRDATAAALSGDREIAASEFSTRCLTEFLIVQNLLQRLTTRGLKTNSRWFMCARNNNDYRK
jgi:hypothetical protein